MAQNACHRTEHKDGTGFNETYRFVIFFLFAGFSVAAEVFLGLPLPRAPPVSEQVVMYCIVSVNNLTIL